MGNAQDRMKVMAAVQTEPHFRLQAKDRDITPL